MRSPLRAAALVVPLLLLACGSSTGKISLRLTDAPGPFASAVVTISRIELVGSGGTVVLRDTPTPPMDLLTLANETVDLVTDAEVPVGDYSQLRFVITGGYIEVKQDSGDNLIYASPGYGVPDGATVAGELRLPSYAESGLKVNLPGGAVHVGTGSHVLLVDFDVSQSYGHDAGGSDAWVMHPVMTAIALELSGTLDVTLESGGVALPGSSTLAQFSAELTSPAESTETLPHTETLPLTDLGGGKFGASFRYLIPGTYTLTFSSSTVTGFTTEPPVPIKLEVVSGQPTLASFVLKSAN